MLLITHHITCWFNMFYSSQTSHACSFHTHYSVLGKIINAVSPDTGAWIQFLVVDALDIVGELVRVAVVGEHLLPPAEAPRGHHRHHRAQHRVRRVHREHRVVLQRGNLILYIATSLSASPLPRRRG